MDVLVAGAYGRCGTALIDHLHDREEYDFTYFNRSDRPDSHPYGGYRTYVGDVSNLEAVQDASTSQDAMIHMAAFPFVNGEWSDVFEPNILGVYNALEAAQENEVESFVFLSSNHVMGMYENEHAPEIYSREYPLVLDHTDPVRPDSYYGASKVFGESLGRFYVENFEYPKRFYALRIGTVTMPDYDHPYGLAEKAVDEGDIERDSSEYQRKVARMKATWLSRRDFAHKIDCCLKDDDVTFGVFNGVSDNRRRWFDLEHGRARIGYSPQDDGEKWDAPPK